ncbi:MAG: (2Fe-2S)-binding protein [Chitinispirillaceae bacterium]|nr:(2Fe-2S)-binding protein [Chitinispirillaceae bacterium]
MNTAITFTIDGTTCTAETGMYVIGAAQKNGIYIPSLCNMDGVAPRGSCRVCTVRINGKLMAACTTPVSEGMKIENDTEELRDLRSQIIETLFVEGNHFCPSCEKSGNCELQALAYRFKIMVPRYPYRFPVREIDASNPKLIKDHNRCILCKRCVRAIKTKDGKNLFAFKNRGHKLAIIIDPSLASSITDELAERASKVCPVGALIKKETGFAQPIGSRTYDRSPIGSTVELAATSPNAKETAL